MSSDDLALSIQEISKAYRIVQSADRPRTLGEAAARRLRRPFQRVTREEFWALREISFDVHEAEVVGIIGRNGAGKSTLLKILSRITEPTTGEAHVFGRVGSLLEVGTGFHPELTGRENVFLNGSILGMSQREVGRRFDEIVEFSGVERFLDTPVKRYSSGMHVRLAFAVAAHLDPEILIVDEVLAVGDAEFQRKCLGKMGEAAAAGERTILFVSHNMVAIKSLCTRCIYLRNGRVELDGTPSEAIARYLIDSEFGGASDDSGVFDHRDRKNPHGPLLIQSVALSNEGVGTGIMKTGDDLSVTVEVEGWEQHPSVLEIRVFSELDHVVGSATSRMRPIEFPPVRDVSERVTCHLRGLPLLPGSYRIEVNLFDPKLRSWVDHLHAAAWFAVVEADIYGSGYQPMKQDGSIALDFAWEVEQQPEAVDLTSSASGGSSARR